MNLSELFHYLVSLSLLGSILTIGIFLIKLMFRQKLSANWHYYIWFVLILRLLIPFTPPSPFSVLNFLPQYTQTINLSHVFIQPSISLAPTPPSPSTVNIAPVSFSSNENTSSPSSVTGKFRLNWATVASVWLTGVLVILSYILVVNGLLLLKSKKQQECDDEKVVGILAECQLSLHVRAKVSVIYDDALKSPALFGFFRPKIIISPEIIALLPQEELRYIFLHELSHIKRRDLLVNTIVTLVQVIYWFNPLIWYALYQIKQECEIACDATVLANVKPEEHKRYGQTIIGLLQLLSEPHWAPGTIGFASKFNTRRIVMISSFRKTTVKWTIAALALTLVVGCSSLSKPINPTGNSQNQKGTATSSQQNTATDASSPSGDLASKSDNTSSNPSNPPQTAPAVQTTDPTGALVLVMMQLAQQGKIFDFDFPTKFPAKSTNIETVEKDWGKPDQTDYVAAAKGTYATYLSHNIVFGFNKGGQISEVRSLASNQFVGITLAKVKEVLGTPTYDTKYNGQEIIGYTAGPEFKIEIVFPQTTINNPDPPMDHYNVLYPQGTVNMMANDPGRQW